MMATPSFEPTRAKWYGVRTSTPAGLTTNEEGAWWYRSDLNIFCYWDGANVHCWGGMGGILFSGDATIVCGAGGDYVINVTLSTPWNPTTINHLLEVHFFTVPVCDPGTMTNPVITAPVVGFTIVGVGAGTTLTARAKVAGW